MQSTTGKKKVKLIFQTKKGFITCSKLIINELGLCPTRSNNVYFANDEGACLHLLMYFVLHMRNIIKLELYNNWSAQAVNNVSESAMWNSKQTNQIHHL